MVKCVRIILYTDIINIIKKRQIKGTACCKVFHGYFVRNVIVNCRNQQLYKTVHVFKTPTQTKTVSYQAIK